MVLGLLGILGYIYNFLKMFRRLFTRRENLITFDIVGEVYFLLYGVFYGVFSFFTV